MSNRRLVCLSELTRGTLPIKCIPIMHKVRAWSFCYTACFDPYLSGLFNWQKAFHTIASIEATLKHTGQ